MGKPLKTADVILTRSLPVDSLDEKQLGDAIALRYQSYSDPDSPDWKYLNSLIHELSRSVDSKFEYRVFLLPDPWPNAAAAPGGVLFVTSGMLEMVETESELVSVIGHEIGHVELGHCMDMVRFELLSRKLGLAPLGELADLAVAISLRPGFSKTMEADADRYGFRLLLQHNYNPFGMANAFDRLAEKSASEPVLQSPMYEYFMSHPYSHHRAERYRTEARLSLPHRYYIGKKNLKSRTSRFEEEYAQEWVSPEY